MSQAAYKWVPVIDRDACTGCGLCVSACDRNCIELVWDFATFTRAGDCGSCGHCQESCQHDVLRMGWMKITGSPAVGQWCEKPMLSPALAQPKHWLFGLFARRTS